MKTETLNITHLLEPKVEKSCVVTMTITALSALSITNNPGNQGFFSLADFEHKIRGMVENMLGVDVTTEMRNDIIKLIGKNKNHKVLFKNRLNSNKWYSIFTHVMDVTLVNPEVFEKAKRFNDLHKRLMRRPMTGTHINGCAHKTVLMKDLQRRLDIYNKNNGLEGDKRWKYDKIRFITETAKDYNLQNIDAETGFIIKPAELLCIDNFNGIPVFHGGVFNRENVVLKDDIQIQLEMTKDVFRLFQKKIQNKSLRNDLYIGDSNSLVNIKEIKFN